jgi:hypothetical protein
MNKLGYQPLLVLVRAEPSYSRWTSNSAKVLRAGATLGTVFALCRAVVICLIGFSAFTPGRFGSKGSAGVPILRQTKVSPTTPAHQDNGVGRLLPDTNQAHHGTIVPDHSIIITRYHFATTSRTWPFTACHEFVTAADWCRGVLLDGSRNGAR